MNYSVEYLKKKIDNQDKIKYLFFWGHQKNKAGSVTKSCFSQWYEKPFIINDIPYVTSEHI